MSATTEAKIKAAARRVFLQKGYDGAKMRDISEEAGVNKGLLHYYFKSKKRLFMAVLGEVLRSGSVDFDNIVQMEVSLEEKITLFVDLYVETLIANPMIPPFVVRELHRDPDNFIGEMAAMDGLADFQGLFDMIAAEMEKGRIKAKSPLQVFLNVPALCVFPFLVKPALLRLLKVEEEGFDNFMRIRKREVTEVIIAGLTSPD